MKEQSIMRYYLITKTPTREHPSNYMIIAADDSTNWPDTKIIDSVQATSWIEACDHFREKHDLPTTTQ